MFDMRESKGVVLSQWSLTFEVRKRWDTSPPFAGYTLSQWSLTFEVRKRLRMGKTRSPILRRNGA